MTKDQLKTSIQSAQVEKELEEELLLLVDQSQEVTEELVNTVADTLEARALLHEQEAEADFEEAKRQDKLAADLNALEDKELEAKIALIKKINAPPENAAAAQNPAQPAAIADTQVASKKEDAKQMETARQTILTASASAKA